MHITKAKILNSNARSAVAMEARTCFISFIKLSLSVLTKRKTIYEAVNSHNSETANHIAYVIFVLHSAIKTHL